TRASYLCDSCLRARCTLMNSPSCRKCSCQNGSIVSVTCYRLAREVLDASAEPTNHARPRSATDDVGCLPPCDQEGYCSGCCSAFLLGAAAAQASANASENFLFS